MIKRTLKRTLLAGAMLAMAGFTTLGTSSTAEARGCGYYGGYGGGGFGAYGVGYRGGFGRAYGVGYGPRAVVVPSYRYGGFAPYGVGYRGLGPRGYGYGGRGVSVSFGF